MKESFRKAAIDDAFIACGEREYAARMASMYQIQEAGKLFDQCVQQYREDYERNVAHAIRYQDERIAEAKAMLKADLERLGYVRRE